VCSFLHIRPLDIVYSGVGYAKMNNQYWKDLYIQANIYS